MSPTLAIMMEADRRKALGIDVVDLSLGEPDFPTPVHVKRGAINAIERDFTKYTATGGMPLLREAICAWHASQFGSSYSPDECIVSAGGKHAIFNAIQALVEEGDEVVIPVPYWVSYPDIVRCAGGRVVMVHTPASDGFCLRAEQVEATLGSRTKLVIVNSPNNPAGTIIPRREFERIYEVCSRRGVWLLSDECYSHFVYDGAEPYSVGKIPGSKPYVIVAGSLSKTFAMTGWRIGYALAPQPLVQAMVKLQSQSTSSPCTISQYAALDAMRGNMEAITTMLEQYNRRRTCTVEGLRAIPGITCTAPDGTFYAFPDVTAHLHRRSRTHPTGPGHFENTAELARQLLESEHVAVVPGEAFGAPGHLRLSYATSHDRIEEGLMRMARFLRSPESQS